MSTDPTDCGFCVLTPGLRAGRLPTPAECPIHGVEPTSPDQTPTCKCPAALCRCGHATDPTPIPANPPAAPGEVCTAALVAARHAPPYKGKLIAAIDSAYAAGLAAGRTAAAADIRATFEARHHPMSVDRLIGERAARVAENGADQ